MDSVWSDTSVRRDSRLSNSEMNQNGKRPADFDTSETDDSSDYDSDDSSNTNTGLTRVNGFDDYTINDFTGRRWPETDVFDDNIFESERKSYIRTSLPVGHVRLVRLLSDETERLIRCETRVFPMSQFFQHRVFGDTHKSSSRSNKLKNDPDSYTAVSYTWGSPVGQHEILLDGRPHLLPKNLWRFLDHAIQIREQIPGWFWIDALSIDQNNPRERMHQVALLYDIFGQAHRVVAWLGPAYEDSEIAMDFLSVKQLMDHWTTPERPVRKICERKYWYRLWVVQELYFARQLYFMCGRSLLQWELFIIPSVYLSHSPMTKPAVNMANLRDHATHASMYKLLRMTKDLHCLDPRDKVYALVNLISDFYEKLDADYTISTSNLARIVLRNMPGDEGSQPSIWPALKKALSLTDDDLDQEMMQDLRRIQMRWSQ